MPSIAYCAPMTVARPLPDELARGHVGRWGRFTENPICPCVHWNAPRTLCPRQMGPATDPVVHIVAALCDTPTEDYIRFHSMLPFLAFSVRENLRTPEGGWAPSCVTRSGVITPRRTAVLCALCCSEDLSFCDIPTGDAHTSCPACFGATNMRRNPCKRSWT